jgi:hypothetical protein
MGAYFVRRNSKDDLYRRVLECYIAMATQAGVPQAVFPEGGLTRNGLLGAPRLGVIDYMLRGFRLDGERDLVFVPLGCNYDRVLEDRTLLRSIDPTRGRSTASGPSGTPLGFVVNNLRLMFKERLAPLRLRLRQFRHAGLGARLLRRARHRLPDAAGGRSASAPWRARRAPDGRRSARWCRCCRCRWWPR